MGREALCAVRYDGAEGHGKVQLETDEVIARGAVRFRAPFRALVGIRDGWLELAWDGHSAAIQLGAQAESWAARIRNPPGLLDKLSVKPGMRVGVIGIEGGFLAELATRVSICEGVVDLLFLRVVQPAELDRIPAALERVAPRGAMWIVSPRGKPDIADTVVLAAGRAAGLVDSKVCRFSETETALRFGRRR
jgi:hypothetical protein